MTDFLDHWANESDANAKLVAEELLITEVTEAILEAQELKKENQDEIKTNP